MALETFLYTYILSGFAVMPRVDRGTALAEGGFAGVCETRDGQGLIFDCGIEESVDPAAALEQAIGLWDLLCRSVEGMEKIPHRGLRIGVSVESQGTLHITAAQAARCGQCGFGILYSIYAPEEEG